MQLGATRSTVGYLRPLCVAAIIAVTCAGLSRVDAQVPPPPPLPGQSDLGTKLAAALSNKDVAAYSALLADDVHVYEDGQLIASDKQQWIAKIGKTLSAPGVQLKFVTGYSSTGRLLFIEYFNSLASWGRTPPPDCCWSYDAVAYDLAAGKVAKIQRLRGGDSRLDDEGNPISR
jgi:hypothetical protein